MINQRNIDLFETQSFRSDSLNITTESQEQSEHVAVCLDRRMSESLLVRLP
jgi:hypothetical protein